MQYQSCIPAVFLSRPNRFIAKVLIDGREESVHVKNTGRCRELLISGVTVYLEESQNPARKTRYSLIAVEKGKRLINMDSQAPNKVVEEALLGGWLPPEITAQGEVRVKREAVWGSSRLDFMLDTGEGPALIEVKGVTLERDGAVFFPDAPTERGIKHIRELAAAAETGIPAFVIFVVQMEQATYFAPNNETHPAFGEALREARQRGVGIHAYTCKVTPGSMTLDEEIPLRL